MKFWNQKDIFYFNSEKPEVKYAKSRKGQRWTKSGRNLSVKVLSKNITLVEKSKIPEN